MQSHVFAKLTENLTLHGIENIGIKNVTNELEKVEFLKTGDRLLRTNQRRKTMFKNSLNFVEPVPLYLGPNESVKGCFAQYIPEK